MSAWVGLAGIAICGKIRMILKTPELKSWIWGTEVRTYQRKWPRTHPEKTREKTGKQFEEMMLFVRILHNIDLYRFFFVLKDLSSFLPVAALLNAFPLIVSFFHLLKEAVSSCPAGQNIAGRLLVQEHWRQNTKHYSRQLRFWFFPTFWFSSLQFWILWFQFVTHQNPNSCKHSSQGQGSLSTCQSPPLSENKTTCRFFSVKAWHSQSWQQKLDRVQTYHERRWGAAAGDTRTWSRLGGRNLSVASWSSGIRIRGGSEANDPSRGGGRFWLGGFISGIQPSCSKCLITTSGKNCNSHNARLLETPLLAAYRSVVISDF